MKITLLLAFLGFYYCSAQENFNVLYGHEEDPIGITDIASLGDDGFIMAGKQDKEGTFVASYFLLRVNTHGDVIWKKSYASGSHFGGKAFVVPLRSGDYMLGILGPKGTNGHGCLRIRNCLIKVDHTGTPIWRKHYTSLISPKINGLMEDMYGNFIVFAKTHNKNTVMSVDVNGNLVWELTYQTTTGVIVPGSTSYPSGNIVQLESGNYLCCSALGSSELGMTNASIACISPGGELLWAKPYGGDADDSGRDLVVAPDGNIIALASTSSFGLSNTDIMLTKMTTEGELIWSKTIGTDCDDVFNRIKIDKDGNLVLLGLINASDATCGIPHRSGLIVKTNPEGELIWSKALPGRVVFYDLEFGVDSSYNVVGSWQIEPGSSIYTGGLFKLKPDGTSCDFEDVTDYFEVNEQTPYFASDYEATSYIEEVITYDPAPFDEEIVPSRWCYSEIVSTEEFSLNSEQIRVFPQPSSGELWFDLTQNESTDFQLSIFNTTGQMVYGQTIFGNTMNKIDLRHLTTGIYYYHLSGATNNDKHYSGKIMIQ